MKFIIIIICLMSKCLSQSEVTILSPRVGTIIDIHENRFYKIFPKVKNFISAQIFLVTDTKYKVRFVTKKKGGRKDFERNMSIKQFVKFQNLVNSQPEFTQEEREIMYAGMDFLRAKEIISDLQKPQFVKIIHSNSKKLKGTLVSFNNDVVQIQTPNNIEHVDLDNIELISYRFSTNEFLVLKPYIYALSGLMGLGISSLYNNQRNTRLDESWYYRFYGITMGLIFSGELYEALSTLLTPTETFILSQERYEQNK